MLGWILITLATTAILVSCCLARCCSPLPILQHHYWTHHLENERELFEQAAEEHSRLLIQQRLKQLFGFVPGSEDVTQIRIPSCQDWREISAPSVLCMEDATQSLYSSLGERVVGDSEEEKSGGIELKP
ncbi:calcium homeostasis modulator protein 4 isoform X3 [Fukomys damarensis]|nr:calcium homeostasis modulator protein 4 isoform X3 [Fukomys damarensis]XP_010612342.1 calcium homeostasis modulator protein 4 isoform X3 [Fukomys damarensis]XP_010612343.1 calcium homeostasis modulator protein 4 isoform X3 [Fukomys damarensis]